jgi:BolA family transcriptional regulator, general stress-responsive regulator
MIMGEDHTANKELTGLETSKNPAVPHLLSRQERLAKVLNASFAPATLEVVDESGQHAGHAGAAPGGQTHYRVRMTSAAFAGMSRLARQRAVLDAAKDEFAAGLHALALELKAPGE